MYRLWRREQDLDYHYRNDNLDELLEYIDPAALDYQTWLGIGMALKDAGYDVNVWDTW